MKSQVDQIVDSLLLKLAGIREFEPQVDVYFMLGSTVSKNPKQLPYTTPLRRYDDYVVLGAIVFNQIDAMVLAKVFGSLVDRFYVDVEKKLPIDYAPNYELIEKYDIHLPDQKKSGAPELGNISHAVLPIIDNKIYFPYKANDITVDAVWTFVASFVGDLSGKNILLVGLGNIGSKLSLKFVESGADVSVIGTREYRDLAIINSLNTIKNKAVLAQIHLSNSIEFSALRADVIVLAASGGEVFWGKEAECSVQCKLVVDVGKGNLSEDALEVFHGKGIAVWRADISDYLPTMISQSKIIKYDAFKKFGFRLVGEYKIISGGWVGRVGDVVVDNFNDPKTIIGICDGKGGFKDYTDHELLAILRLIKSSLGAS